MNASKFKLPSSRVFYVGMLIAVAVLWGLDPIVNSILYEHYSAAALSTLSTVFSALLFFLISMKKLKLLNRDYLKIALPIALCNSLACLLQRIGLQYTTPAKYSFLEYLSCIVVPIVQLIVLRKSPSKIKWLSCSICLVGCLLLTGAAEGSLGIGVGEILCALAGILFGVAIFSIGQYTKKLDMGLFMMIHMSTYFLSSLILTVVLHLVRVDGVPMEAFSFSFNPEHLIPAALFGFLSVGLCWLMKNEAIRHLAPTTSAVIGPFAAVVSAVVSIARGTDLVTPSLIIAIVMIVGSAVLSGIGDHVRSKSDQHPQKTK